jgi:hypothetical protein
MPPATAKLGVAFLFKTVWMGEWMDISKGARGKVA